MLGPPKKEIREDGNRRVRVRLEPVDYGVMELTQGVDEEDISMIAKVLDIFYTRGNGGVAGQGENEGLD